MVSILPFGEVGRTLLSNLQLCCRGSIFLLLAMFLSNSAFAQVVSCPYSGAQSATTTIDTDPLPVGATTQTGSYQVLPAALASRINVVGNASVIVCYYGDVEAANETWGVTISGQSVATTEGAFTPAPSAATPRCRTYNIANSAFQADVSADGDLDFEFNLNGSGWQYNSIAADASGDDFSYYIQTVTFNYLLDVPLVASTTEACPGAATDPTFTSSFAPGTYPGDSGSFSIEPASATAALSSATVGSDIVATLDVSAVPSGQYMITYTYNISGCEYAKTVNFRVTQLPSAALQDISQTCLSPGSSFSLSTMLAPGATPGGTFTVDGNASNGTFTVPVGGGTFSVNYTVDGGPCLATGPIGTAMLTITTSRDASFTINGPSSPACSDGGNVIVSLVGNDAANAANHTFTVNGAPPSPSAAAAALPAPSTIGTISYTICMTATNGTPDNPATTDVNESCPTTVCRNYVTRNDGNACGANSAFPSTCEPFETQLCPIDTKSDLRIECGFFQLDLGQIAEAGLTPRVGQLSCTDTELVLDWTGQNLLDDSASQPINSPGNPSVASLAGLGGFCEFVTEDFCIPIPFADDICPLAPIGDLLQCNTSISGLLSAALTLSTQGSRGGLIMADTDGDGAFDYLAEEYSEGPFGSAPPTAGTVTIPNNVVGSGYISVRNVYGYPDNPKGVCGDPAAGGPDLLEILPIGAIPIAGPIIENVLTIAGCSIDLSFTDEATVQIPVYNDHEPSWANCPVDSYRIITNTSDCNVPANWSIPVAYDACTELVLPYNGRTNGTSTTYFEGTASPEVVPGQGGLTKGVYQTAGPVLGSDLPVGIHTIEFTAYSCEARTSTCTFNVVVENGDLQLICPRDITVKNDAGICEAVVNSLEPLSGLSCLSIINYRIDYPVSSGLTPVLVTTPYTVGNAGTWNLVSGLSFPLGTSTITYTMLIDFNGDGDVDDLNEVQMCDFEVTVLDTERPAALCRDIHVTLDNTGNTTVFAVDQMDGTPFLNGGSYDNCDTDLSIQLQVPGQAPVDFIGLDCDNVGYNAFNLIVTDDSGNVSTCIATVEVHEFFENIQLQLDLPELCLGALNPEQLDFSNYLNITLPDGTILNHNDVSANAFLGDVEGAFGITAFYADNASASLDPGSISADGIYTPGTGSGFVTISYAMALPGVNIPQNGNLAFATCFTIVHATFELRQPLQMDDPNCECIVQNDRVVNLGVVSGGLEPYTIQYTGVKLDINSDGIADDVDGQHTYSVENGADISDFMEDLGNLLVDYTVPIWAFTIVDARGCELFHSGSCDNDDETGTPMIDCTALGAVTLYTRDEPACEVQDTWTHTLPTDNCDVILYTYTIENPDGTIAGPFDLTALVNPDITNPLPDQFYGEYDFQHHSPTENVSTVTYYAEDAVGNYTQCSFTVTVIDDDAPSFINCPEPAVIVDAPPTWCAAFANYSLPLATDNCGEVTVTQIDDTGLTSGSLFPVGITINTFEAVDATGNTTTCDVKIIVNDYHTPPTLACPSDVNTINDDGDCGAIVDDIAPSGILDNCPDNLTVTYRIDDEDGNLIASGLDDASGTFFDLGTSTVSYAVQDMPLLLITEVTHELANTVDGVPVVAPSCFDGIQNGDETGVDCGGGTCPSCNCTNNEVVIEILLDNNPTQTTWTITEPNNGAILASGDLMPLHRLVQLS
ncbi:MAG: HYR domain-containing protein [Saprospiraceae bacterium]